MVHGSEAKLGRANGLDVDSNAIEAVCGDGARYTLRGRLQVILYEVTGATHTKASHAGRDGRPALFTFALQNSFA